MTPKKYFVLWHFKFRVCLHSAIVTRKAWERIECLHLNPYLYLTCVTPVVEKGVPHAYRNKNLVQYALCTIFPSTSNALNTCSHPSSWNEGQDMMSIGTGHMCAHTYVVNENNESGGSSWVLDLKSPIPPMHSPSALHDRGSICAETSGLCTWGSICHRDERVLDNALCDLHSIWISHRLYPPMYLLSASTRLPNQALAKAELQRNFRSSKRGVKKVN